MSNELLEWLDANKIQYEILDDEVVNVEGLGKMYYEDTNLISSIFRTDLQNNVKFNATENIETLHDEEIFYIV